MDLGLFFLGLLLFVGVLFDYVGLENSNNGILDGLNASVYQNWANFLTKIIQSLHSRPPDPLVLILSHQENQLRNQQRPKMLLNLRRKPVNTRQSLLILRKHTPILRLQVPNRQVCVTVADLDSDVVVEELVVFLEDLVCSLEVRSKFQRTGFGELA